MSISDRLDEIAERCDAATALTLGEDNARDCYNIAADDVPAILAALRAVLDLCDRALAVKVSGASEGDAAMAAFAAATHSAITAALGEGS